jgi:hypothetical protein
MFLTIRPTQVVYIYIYIVKVNISLKLQCLLLVQATRVLTLSNNFFLDCRFVDLGLF